MLLEGEDATFGAAAINSLGYNAFPVLNSKDSVYKIKHTFAHDKGQLLLNFFSILGKGGHQELGVNKRGWGLDNVRIEVHSEELSEILPKGADETKVVFEDSFDDVPKGAWSQTKTEMTPNEKTKFLGQFESDTVKLTLNDLPPHKIARISFDLYIINTWEGVGPDDNGPDYLTLYHGEEDPGNKLSGSNGRAPLMKPSLEVIPQSCFLPPSPTSKTATSPSRVGTARTRLPFVTLENWRGRAMARRQ